MIPFELSDPDKLTIQVRDLLRSDEELMAWTNGVIERVSELRPDLDSPPPQILVFAGTESETFEPSSKGSVEMAVAILVVWEDNSFILSDDEPSMSSVVQHIKGLVMGNYFMNVPPVSERIVRRVDGFDVVDYSGQEIRGRTIRHLLLGITFIVNLHVTTRKVVCYS